MVTFYCYKAHNGRLLLLLANDNCIVERGGSLVRDDVAKRKVLILAWQQGIPIIMDAEVSK